MTHGSLFSGIGGFDLAAEWMGWQNVFHCEWMPFPRQVLHYYWPEAISYEDVTKTDFSVHRGAIDILTGGFPCQPYSAAGKRLGTEDNRHLWPHMLRAIREIQPRWVVGENVRGLTNWNDWVVFDEVQADLESAGYEVLPFLLPACAVNAPHRRDRIWFVAYNSVYGNAADATSDRREWPRQEIEVKEGLQTRPKPTGKLEWGFERLCRNGHAADASGKRLQRGQNSRGIAGIGQKSHKQPTRHICSDWQVFPTQSPICGGDDGLPTELDGITFPKWRAESIKGYGNAIVPQVALQIFKAIEQYVQSPR